MSIRVGQMTDIHVPDFSDLRAVDFVGKRATGWVNFTRKRAEEYDQNIVRAGVTRFVEERPDLVVITGDLTNLALPSEFRASLHLLEPLREAGIRTVVFPGNHDYYVPSAANGQFEEMCEGWQPSDARGDQFYPFGCRAGDVAVLCFNSAIPTPPMLAYGVVDDAQIARGKELAAAETAAGRTIVFALHHHPTRAPHKKREWPRGLRNAQAFRTAAAECGAVLVMHGHNHYEHARRMLDAEHVCISGISSSTTSKEAPPVRVGQIGLYEFEAGVMSELSVASWGGSEFGDWKRTQPSEVPVETSYEALKEQ
jgi:3',5'-cyclic AMP phosphodiesterase CpdA